ncbi:MAG: acetyl-CoA C-acyltransferase [Planctomycetes bacterium]|nr:acetyl-CoA C-acyltransferase [Planctomycetota bacterium]
MGHPVIVSACRTAIAKFQGALSAFTAPQLGGFAVKEALQRSGVPAAEIDEVLMGNVLQAGLGQNPARQALRAAGIPDSKAAVTINKVCGSGLKTVMLAAQAIKAGDLQCAVAGGMESMTNTPYLLPAARAGARLGHTQALDGIVWDGLWDHYNDFHMGNTGELVADKYGVTREEQDVYAADSHRKAAAAQTAGAFDAEIFNVEVPQRKKDPIQFNKDDGPRADSTPEALGKLRPAFKRDGGSVTAGNASSINDGAAATVVCSEEFADAHGLQKLARITGYATGGLAPEWVMMAPEVATKKLCALLGVGVGDFDLIEMNEAFSVQMIALQRQLGADPAKWNVHGGAVALGHPIGCSGTRVLVTLLHALKRHDKTTGIAGLCLGGGNAVAMSVERL